MEYRNSVWEGEDVGGDVTCDVERRWNVYVFFYLPLHLSWLQLPALWRWAGWWAGSKGAVDIRPSGCFGDRSV